MIGTPLFFTNLIVGSTVAGLVYYEEYKTYKAWQIAVFPAGICVVCAGVMFMSLKGIDAEELRRVERELALANQGKSLRNLLNSPKGSLRNLLKSPHSRSAVDVYTLDKRRRSSSAEPAHDNHRGSSSETAPQDSKRTRYSGNEHAPSGAEPVPISTSFQLDPDLEKGPHEPTVV